MTFDRIPKKILEWRIDGKRRRGRPEEGWMDGVRSKGQLDLQMRMFRTATNGKDKFLEGDGKPLYCG